MPGRANRFCDLVSQTARKYQSDCQLNVLAAFSSIFYLVTPSLANLILHSTRDPAGLAAARLVTSS